jgi:hypothetical protein
MSKSLIVTAMLLLAAQPLLAQNKKVYRCENDAGRVTYSDEACKGGAELKNDDARSGEQRQAAAEAAKREGRLADKLTRERRAAEKAAGGASVALIPYSAAEKAAKEQPSGKQVVAKKIKKKVKAPASEKIQG